MVSLLASFCAVLFSPLDVLDEIWDVIESVSEGFLTYSWVHSHVPENKAQSRQWVGPGFQRPKKFKIQPSAGKVMPVGHSILVRSGRYYVGLFTQKKYNNWSVLCKLSRPAENRYS